MKASLHMENEGRTVGTRQVKPGIHVVENGQVASVRFFSQGKSDAADAIEGGKDIVANDSSNDVSPLNFCDH